MRRRLVAGACAAALAAVSARAIADEGGGGADRVSLRAELGPEYDSNVHRAERLAGIPVAPIVASPLLRAVLGWSAVGRVARGQEVGFSLVGAGKLFTEPAARSENVAIVETSGNWRLAAGPRTQIGVSAAYYEAIQDVTAAERAVGSDARDFRSLAPAARVGRTVGEAGALSLGAGYRWLVYKPLRSYDFAAPFLSLQYQWARETADGGAEWEIAAGGALELRRFAGARLVPNCQPQPSCLPVADPRGARHDDQFFAGLLEVTRTGTLLVGLGYGLQWNRSNSYSESVVRHIGLVRLTAPLFLGVYLAARGELVYASYADPVALAIGPSGVPSATFEDENRSQVRAELSRDLGTHFQLVARGTYYANALGGVAGYSYSRFTTTLSLVLGL